MNKRSFFIVCGLILGVAGVLSWQNLKEQPEPFSKALHADRSLSTKTLKTKARLDRYQVVDDFSNINPETLKLEDSTLSNKERVAAMRALGHDLTDEERDFLYSFLMNDENTRFTLWIKDEVMCKLEEQLVRPKEYESALYTIMTDTSIDGDLRGYAAQHLRSAYTVEGVDKDLVESALLEGAQDRQSDVAGTALLALDEIYRNSDRPAQHESILSESRDLALDGAAHLPSRLTALSLVLQNPEVINDDIRGLAQQITAEGSAYDTAFKLVANRILTLE